MLPEVNACQLVRSFAPPVCFRSSGQRKPPINTASLSFHFPPFDLSIDTLDARGFFSPRAME